MKKFLIKGILNDRSRSLLPVIVVSLGVFLTVLLHGWITGMMGESIILNANINTGHVKIMSKAYAEEKEQIPNDLALMGVDTLVESLQMAYPELKWVKRIRFGALADIPDSTGETRAQGPVAGWAIDLLNPASEESKRFNLEACLTKGRLPAKHWEALISDEFATKFNLLPGQSFTLFGTTMDGSMAFKNFTLAGTLKFGAKALDKGAVIIDIDDARLTFGMEDAAGEILGFFPVQVYDDTKAQSLKNLFNSKYKNENDPYAPVMMTLSEQEGMGQMLAITETMSSLLIFVFIMAMAVVLWNSGILGGLRRYTEFGVRLAMGEDKWHVYKTLLWEGLIIGIIGSVIGTALGLTVSYIIHVVGFDMSGMMQNSSLLMPTVARTIITPTAFYIGFIPGVFSMVIGNALAGIGIFKRSTARLFNELEV